MFERTVRDSTYFSFLQCILIRLGNNDVPFHQLRRTGRPVPPSRLVCAASAPRRITGVTAYQLPTLARMVKMRYGYFFFIILEVAAIGSEALVAPRNCISQNHDRVPTLQHRLVVEAPTTKQHVSSHQSSKQYTSDADQHHGRTIRYSRTLLYSSTGKANGEVEIYDRMNEFRPRTMKVSESVAFFARFVAQSILDKRAQKSLGRENRRRLRDRLKRVAFVRKATKELVATTKKKGAKGAKQRGMMGSIRKLNESRKSLIRLVGYDSSMMVPGEQTMC